MPSTPRKEPPELTAASSTCDQPQGGEEVGYTQAAKAGQVHTARYASRLAEAFGALPSSRALDGDGERVPHSETLALVAALDPGPSALGGRHHLGLGAATGAQDGQCTHRQSRS